MTPSPITHIDQLEAIEEEWREIFSETDPKSPFLSFEFIKLWYNCFSEVDQVRIYRATDDEQTIGFLPLRLCSNKNIRTLMSLTNDHCLHSGPLVRMGFEQQFPEIIIRELLKDGDVWDLIRYGFSYSFSQYPGLFSDDLLNNCDIYWERRSQPTYTVSLSKSFEQYFREDISSNARKNIMKSINKLKKAGSSSYLHYQGREAVKRWPEFVKIEDSGWKGSAGSSIKKLGVNYQRYYEGLINLLADIDALSMYFLELNNKLIAGVFGYFEGDTFHWFKTGYDEQYKEFSPSNLLIVHIIEDLINNFPAVERFHMFPWDYNYKHRFINEETSCNETILFSRTLRGRAMWLFFDSKERLKTLLARVS